MALPFLAGLALKAAPVTGFFKSVPRWAWIALAVAALIGAGLFFHARAVSSAIDAAEKRGEKRADARHAKKAREWEARINGISANLRSRNSETNRRIAGDADALRVRGPGKAACLNPATPAASGHLPPGRAADAPVAEVPDGERVDLIALPFADAIAFAEQHDLCRAEVLTWREQSGQQAEAWQKENGQ